MAGYRGKKGRLIWWQVAPEKEGILITGATPFDMFEIASLLNSDIDIDLNPVSFEDIERETPDYGFDTRLNMPGYLSPTEFGVMPIHDGNGFLGDDKDDDLNW